MPCIEGCPGFINPVTGQQWEPGPWDPGSRGPVQPREPQNTSGLLKKVQHVQGPAQEVRHIAARQHHAQWQDPCL